ncbi:MAG: hypothetical protein QOF25_2411 [Mycobacterium sp.]|nr:hypothetical protein [Mycobacterium sp.]
MEFYTRDELWTGRRLMVQADDGDDDLGAVLTIIDTSHDHRTICVDLCDVESQRACWPSSPTVGYDPMNVNSRPDRITH